MRFTRTSISALLLFLLAAPFCFSQNRDSLHAVYYFQQFQDYEYVDGARARIYADSGLYYAKRTKNDELIAMAYQFLGWYYQDNSRFQTANDYFYKSLAAYKKAGKAQGVADAYGNLGNSYLDMNEYQKSLDYQLLSLDANQAILDKKGISKEARANARIGKTYALHNIGAIYSDIGMYEKALEYEYTSIAYEFESNNLEGVAISYNTLATLYRDLKMADSAIYYFKKAIDLFESDEVNYPFGYASALQFYASMKNNGLSLKQKNEMWKRSIEIRQGFGDVDGEVRTLLDLTEQQLKTLPVDSLSKLVGTIYGMITEYDLDILMERYLKLYSEYNSRIGKYDSAYFALENYLELKAISDEKTRTHDLVVGDIKHQIETKRYNDSLKIEHGFALERAAYNEKFAKFQDVFYLSIIGSIILIVSLIFFITSSRRRKRMNELLTDKNNLIQQQKSIVEEKNRSIGDSINYARRLQLAILPTTEQVNKFLPESFLFFRPKDIVSGDFYWFEEKDGQLFVAVADCTGHGVPGAMVSVVCSNALNRCVNEFGLRAPKDILDRSRDLVIETFAKSGDNVADGMDIGLIAIDKGRKKLVFAGAQNALWIVRKGLKKVENADSTSFEGDLTFLEFKGDKQPVGLYAHMQPFTQKQIDLEEGDTLYLSSDGFADQFGGDSGKKFKYAPIKKFLLENNHLSMNSQKEALVKIYDEWKGKNEQVDDVCFVGMKVR